MSNRFVKIEWHVFQITKKKCYEISPTSLCTQNVMVAACSSGELVTWMGEKDYIFLIILVTIISTPSNKKAVLQQQRQIDATATLALLPIAPPFCRSSVHFSIKFSMENKPFISSR